MTGAGSIVHYHITDRDCRIINPFLEEVSLLVKSAPTSRDAEEVLKKMRSDLVMKYAFTIPYYELIAAIAASGPIVEIGAGSGYWAWMLSQAGSDVVAIDRFSPDEVTPWDFTGTNQWYDETWYFVDEGEALSAGAWPERSLFLAWPLYADPMAYDALRAYEAAGGKKVIFLGDVSMAGDENFHRKLKTLRQEIRMPCMGWPGLNEELIVASL